MSLRQRVLLASHHSTSLQDRRRLQVPSMGRGKKYNTERSWQNPSYGQYGQHTGSEWSLWRGAWKASPRNTRPSQEAGSSFPAYDAAWQDATAIMEIQPTKPVQPPASGGLVYDVQQAINSARRLEQKLNRTRKELLQKGRAWDQWVLKMRTSYKKEHDRYTQEQRRLTGEIQDLEALTREAYGNVQQAAFLQSSTSSSAQQPPPPGLGKRDGSRGWHDQQSAASRADQNDATGSCYGWYSNTPAEHRNATADANQTCSRRSRTSWLPSGRASGSLSYASRLWSSTWTSWHVGPSLSSAARSRSTINTWSISRGEAVGQKEDTSCGHGPLWCHQAPRRPTSGISRGYSSSPDWWPDRRRRQRRARWGTFSRSQQIGRMISVSIDLGASESMIFRLRFLCRASFLLLPKGTFRTQLWLMSGILPSRRGLSRCYAMAILDFSPCTCTKVDFFIQLPWCPPEVLPTFHRSCPSVQSPNIGPQPPLHSFQPPVMRVRNSCIGRSGATTSSPCGPVDLHSFGFECTSSSHSFLQHHDPPFWTFFCPLVASMDFLAPNTQIGGSGLWARILESVDSLMSFLESIGLFLVPLFRSLLGLLFLSVLRLLCSARLVSATPLGSALSFFTRGHPASLALPLAQIARPQAVLSWRNDKSHGKKRCRHGQSSHRQAGLGAILMTCLCAPFQVSGNFVTTAYAMPAARWILFPTTAHAMARAGWPDDLPLAASASPAPPPVVPHSEGISQVEVPSLDPEVEAKREEHIILGSLPWSNEASDAMLGQSLGCYIYAPHYSPTAVVVRMPPEADWEFALDVLRSCALGVPDRLFDAIVPIRPQRIPGYLSVLRFPSIIRKVHDGYAAIICDLTRVGGTYFAAVLSRNISHETLVQYLLPMTSYSDNELCVVVGCRSRVWPREALVTLNDGEAIIGVWHSDADVSRHRAEELSDRRLWGPLRHFFEPERHVASCVMYQDQRYNIREYFHPPGELLSYVTQYLHLDTTRTVACTFGIQNLDVQG